MDKAFFTRISASGVVQQVTVVLDGGRTIVMTAITAEEHSMSKEQWIERAKQAETIGR